MKMILLFAVLLLSCVKEDDQKARSINTTNLSAVANTTNSDDFSDLKKEGDEECDSEEDLEKKIMEEAKKKPEKAFKLQGGDTGCSTD